MNLEYSKISEQVRPGMFSDDLRSADPWITAFFTMSIRYLEDYYVRQDSGNTVFFLNGEEDALLFYFSRSADGRSYYINGYRIEQRHLRKVWLFMPSLILKLREETFEHAAGVNEAMLDERFLENVSLFYAASGKILMPYSFIITLLPDECFPECENIRIFNDALLEDVSKHLCLITDRMIREAASETSENMKMRYAPFVWTPPSRKGSPWALEYYTNRVVKKGSKRSYEVLQETTQPVKGDSIYSLTRLFKQANDMLDKHR